MSSVRNLSHQLADVCQLVADRDKSTRTSAPENCEPFEYAEGADVRGRDGHFISNRPCVIDVATPPGTRLMGTKLRSASRQPGGS